MSEVEYRTLARSRFKCTYCSSDATVEATLSRRNVTAIIRCCDDAQCMRRPRDVRKHTRRLLKGTFLLGPLFWIGVNVKPGGEV